MAVCGVIAEYDPFHRGHERHLMKARQLTGADCVAVVMSGSFTQRGMPALLPAHVRAEMALRCGADIVLQLPYAFSVREAEFFALGGVGILNALGCVTHLSFGCETDDLSLLNQAADILENEDGEIREGLDRGLSYAAAAGGALNRRLGGAVDLNAPNAALAIAYLRALKRLHSPIVPVPVLRSEDYHARELGVLPSASALRGAILRGDWQGALEAVPENARETLSKALLQGQICPPERMDRLIRCAALLNGPEAIAHWPGVGEWMENRIQSAARKAVTREEIILAVKTRRYTYGRISRALCHGALNVPKADLPSCPAFTRLLGFRESARPVIRRMRDSGFPMITRLAREESAALDARADDMWRVLAGLPQGDTYRRPPVII